MKEQGTGNGWDRLRRFTQARIALGRSGNSMPTQAVLAFGLAHAQARDAVHLPMQLDQILGDLRAAGYSPLCVESEALDRTAYLSQPHLGRRLRDPSRAVLADFAGAHPSQLAVVIADGLSAVAPERHALPLLKLMSTQLRDWKIGPIVVAQQARVALGDEIGEILDAEAVVMLIGERPGLSSPDSLGIYLTYRPRIGRTDAERNCISNVRPEGLSYEAALHKLSFLLEGARRLQATGVMLHDETDEVHLLPPSSRGNAGLL